MFVSLVAACSSLPNREIPKELGIDLEPSRETGHPSEYVFCEMAGGAWGCEEVSPKTLVAMNGASTDPQQPIADAVRSTLQGMVAKASSENLPASDRNNAATAEAAASGAASAAGGKAAAGATLDKEPLVVIQFGFDSAILPSTAKLKLLDLRSSISGKTLELHGYTDSVGDEDYNDSLALQRARAVSEFLRKVSPSSVVSANGDGSCCYIVPNDSAQQRAKNRRVAVFLKN